MANILCSPSKYVQGAGEMKKLGEYAQKYGKKALVLITESGYKRIEDVLKVGFEGYDIEPVYEYFNRECSKTEINRLVAVMNEKFVMLLLVLAVERSLILRKQLLITKKCRY